MSDTPGSPVTLDPSDVAQAAVLERLRTDLIGWFTTVRSDGSPHAVPVWFFWHDGRVLVMSEPDTAKVRNVRRGSPVLLHLETAPGGDGVVVLSGPCVVSERSSTEWLPEVGEAYEAKYREAIAAFGMSLPDIAAKFSTVLELTPTRLQHW